MYPTSPDAFALNSTMCRIIASSLLPLRKCGLSCNDGKPKSGLHPEPANLHILVPNGDGMDDR